MKIHSVILSLLLSNIATLSPASATGEAKNCFPAYRYDSDKNTCAILGTCVGLIGGGIYGLSRQTPNPGGRDPEISDRNSGLVAADILAGAVVGAMAGWVIDRIRTPLKGDSAYKLEILLLKQAKKGKGYLLEKLVSDLLQSDPAVQDVTVARVAASLNKGNVPGGFCAHTLITSKHNEDGYEDSNVWTEYESRKAANEKAGFKDEREVFDYNRIKAWVIRDLANGSCGCSCFRAPISNP